MQVFRTLAGYSLGRADIVRRAMSKKKHDVMAKERTAFVEGEEGENGCIGCVKNGIPREVAEKIFDEMSAFSSYAFNKSHAAAYAVVSYRTAYLKCHYPKEYLAALLTSVLDSADKVGLYIVECERLGLKVLPPSVNESDAGFTACEQGVRFGLLGVRNLGTALISQLVADRDQNGNFASLSDFCHRLAGQQLNRRAIESLIKCGAFDGMGANRRQMLQTVDSLMKEVEAEKRRASSGQMDLFGMTADSAPAEPIPLPDVEEIPLYEKLRFEKEIIGIYVSGHPMQDYESYVKSVKATYSTDLSDTERAASLDGKIVTVVGICDELKKRTTKSNNLLGQLTLEDRYGVIHVLMFATILEKYGALCEEGKILKVTGRVSVRENADTEILAETVTLVTEEDKSVPTAKSSTGDLYLRLPSRSDRRFDRALSLMADYPGDTRVILVFEDDGKRLLAPTSKWVTPSDDLMDGLAVLLGEDNVKLTKI